jgi:hypothetical protein
MLWSKCLKCLNKLEVHTMYTNVNVEQNSNIDKIDKLHNNSLNNRITSSKYPNTFIHHHSHLLNYEYMISIYTNSHLHMRHNSNIDKRDKLHNKFLKNMRTSSKYPNTFIHQINP